jgi:hypothetical protein
MFSTSLSSSPPVAPPYSAVPRPPYRLVAVLAVFSSALLTIGTVLHPAHADPGSPAAAFVEYAGVSRGMWVAGHLLQLGGAAGMVLVVVLLTGTVDGTRGSAWARAVTVFGSAGLATAAVLQAVDGVALKAVVDLWSGAGEDRGALFAGALAVRQVEIGLDAVFSVALAATTLLFGLVLVRGSRGRRALGAVALVTAATATAAGILFGLQGFSTTAMNMGAASGVLGVDLTITASVWGWRRTSRRRA